MAVFVKPVVASETQHSPIVDGAEISPSYIPLSDAKSNLLERDGTGLYVVASDLISSVENNLLYEELDGKLAVLRNPNLIEIAETDAVLDYDCNGLRVGLFLRYVPEESRLDLLGKDKATILSSITLPVAIAGILVSEVVFNYQPPAPEGAVSNPNPVGTYIHIHAVMTDGSKRDMYLNVSGLDEPEVNVADLISTDSKTLVVDDAGKLDTDFKLKFDEPSGNLSLVGSDGTVLQTVYISGASTFLEASDLVVNPEGQPEGTYIYLRFREASGDTNELYINVSGLVDKYHAGKAIHIDGDNTISVKIAVGGGLKVGAAGNLRVDFDTLLSRDTDNLLSLGSDGRLKLVAEKVLGAVGVSADAGNVLALGSDGKVYYPADKGILDN